jgi:hypothetical protein
MIKTMRWLIGAPVGFLALGGVGAAATHYLYEPYNPGFLKYPKVVALHVVLCGLYLALASVAGAWIRLTRKRRVPRAGGAEATYDPIPGRG